MRILHLVHQYPPENFGGTELYTQTLARQQLLAGHSVAVFAPATKLSTNSQPTNDKVINEYRPAIKHRGPIQQFIAVFSDRSLIRSFQSALDEFRPDLVHIEHPMGLPARIVTILNNSQLPFVVTLHDYWYICANAQLVTNYDHTICSGPDRYLNCSRCALNRAGLPSSQLLAPTLSPVMAWRNQKIRPFLDEAQKLIAPTHFVRQLYAGFGINSAKITVIPHGIEVPERALTLEQPINNVLRISYIGGLSWQKGIHVLIEAVNRMPESGVKLTIHGDQNAFPEYVSSLKELAQHSRITFVGKLERDRLWTALSSCDVVVVPSLWYETASLIVQESFAAGVPVIASRIGALQERVNDGVDGLLTNPGDADQLYKALLSLYHNPDLILKFRQGIQPVRTIVEHAQDIEQLYETIIHK